MTVLARLLSETVLCHMQISKPRTTVPNRPWFIFWDQQKLIAIKRVLV